MFWVLCTAAAVPAPLWLDHDRPTSATFARSFRPTALACENAGSRACAEVAAGLEGMLHVTLRPRPTAHGPGAIVLAEGGGAWSWPPVADEEAFTMQRRPGGELAVTSGSSAGLLYGAFALLRMVRLEDAWLLDPAAAPVHSAPAAPLRLWDLWDNWDGTVERGYAGASVFDWAALPALQPRYEQFARLLASIAINGIVWNNVNACGDGNDRNLVPTTLRAMAPLVKLFAEFGIRSLQSPCYGAPKTIGKLRTADPRDPAVARFWAETANFTAATWAPGAFAGYVVKADCEGQPGPSAFNLSELEGANLLADALAPVGAAAIWRAFAHPPKGEDQAIFQYERFKGWSEPNATRPNVVLQIKNGPFDFQVREPVHSLFGLKHVNLLLEVQATQEYLGQARHVAALPQQWKSYLDSHLSDTVRLVDVVSGPRRFAGLTAVSNFGADPTWTGSAPLLP